MNKPTITPISSDNNNFSNFLDTERIIANANKMFLYQKICQFLLNCENNNHSQLLKYMFEDTNFKLYTKNCFIILTKMISQNIKSNVPFKSNCIIIRLDVFIFARCC